MTRPSARVRRRGATKEGDLHHAGAGVRVQGGQGARRPVAALAGALAGAHAPRVEAANEQVEEVEVAAWLKAPLSGQKTRTSWTNKSGAMWVKLGIGAFVQRPSRDDSHSVMPGHNARKREQRRNGRAPLFETVAPPYAHQPTPVRHPDGTQE